MAVSMEVWQPEKVVAKLNEFFEMLFQLCHPIHNDVQFVNNSSFKDKTLLLEILNKSFQEEETQLKLQNIYEKLTTDQKNYFDELCDLFFINKKKAIKAKILFDLFTALYEEIFIFDCKRIFIKLKYQASLQKFGKKLLFLDPNWIFNVNTEAYQNYLSLFKNYSLQITSNASFTEKDKEEVGLFVNDINAVSSCYPQLDEFRSELERQRTATVIGPKNSSKELWTEKIKKYIKNRRKSIKYAINDYFNNVQDKKSSKSYRITTANTFIVQQLKNFSFEKVSSVENFFETINKRINEIKDDGSKFKSILIKTRKEAFDELCAFNHRHANKYILSVNVAKKELNKSFLQELKKRFCYYTKYASYRFHYKILYKWYYLSPSKNSQETRIKTINTITLYLEKIINKLTNEVESIDAYVKLIKVLRKEYDKIENSRSALKQTLQAMQYDLIERLVLGRNENKILTVDNRNYKMEFTSAQLKKISEYCINIKNQKPLIPLTSGSEEEKNAVSQTNNIPSNNKITMTRPPCKITEACRDQKEFEKLHSRLINNTDFTIEDLARYQQLKLMLTIETHPQLNLFFNSLKAKIADSILAGKTLRSGRVVAANKSPLVNIPTDAFSRLPIQDPHLKLAATIFGAGLKIGAMLAQKTESIINNQLGALSKDVNQIDEVAAFIALIVTLRYASVLRGLDYKTSYYNSIERMAECVFERILQGLKHWNGSYEKLIKNIAKINPLLFFHRYVFSQKATDQFDLAHAHTIKAAFTRSAGYYVKTDENGHPVLKKNEENGKDELDITFYTFDNAEPELGFRKMDEKEIDGLPPLDIKSANSIIQEKAKEVIEFENELAFIEIPNGQTTLCKLSQELENKNNQHEAQKHQESYQQIIQATTQPLPVNITVTPTVTHNEHLQEPSAPPEEYSSFPCAIFGNSPQIPPPLLPATTPDIDSSAHRFM